MVRRSAAGEAALCSFKERVVTTVTILLFAAAADAVGVSRLEMEVQADCSAGELLALLGAAHPAARPLLERVAVAVNERYAPPSARLAAGDTVAIIPPVSGG